VNGDGEMTPLNRIGSVPYAISAGGSVPIGSVIAWHEDFANTPSLPDGWVECNGQVLSDIESVYDGLMIPDLNSTVEGTFGYFLRGSHTSGNTQSSQNKGHTHQVGCETGTGGNQHLSKNASQVASLDWYTTASSGGSESRPVSFTIVWIMRVK